MTAIEQIVGEFIDAWKAGRRPDVAEHLERADPQDRDEVAAQLQTWLEMAPTPDYDGDARAAIAAEPLLQAALQAAEEQRLPLADRLPTLRQRAGLALRDVAGRLADVFEVKEAERIEGYLERLEADDLDERRISRRLLDGLAAVLGADQDALAPRRAAAGQTFFRLEVEADAIEHDFDVLSRTALSSAPEQPLDEIDRLFLGGPDA